MTYSPLLRSLFDEPDDSLFPVIEAHLKKGENPDAGSKYGETPLKQAYRRRRMDVFSLLLDYGADLSAMNWGPLHRAVALGGMEELQSAAMDGDMSARDVEGLTPFLLACEMGEIEKAALLLPLSEREDRYRTHQREPALAVAAAKGRVGMVSWLLANGFEVNETNEFGGTALIAAAASGEVETVRILLEAGADIAARYNLSASVRNIDLSELDLPPLSAGFDEYEFFQTAASESEDADVARLLIGTGVEPHDFDNDVLRELTGAALIAEQQVTPEMFKAQKHPRLGAVNPESVADEFWLEMIRTGLSGYCGHEKYGGKTRGLNEPAIWSFSRHGMSTTQLPDGRWVQIAGEHEDWYDPDFYIYNDVVVHDGAGNAEIFIYPREIFPPTDFHTATLVEDAIILIGSLGYQDERPVGETQVLRLDLTDFSVERVETTGESPGWISEHRARLDGDRIVVWGGKVWDGADYAMFKGTYALSLPTGAWEKFDQE